MTLKLTRVVSAVLLLSIIMASCKKDDTSEKCESTEIDYDAKILAAINNATNGEGVSALKLPDSFDFNSIPQDPLNPITAAKVELGKLLFHETALAVNAKYENGVGSYSCSSCHHAGGGFQANIKQGIGDGGSGYGLTGEGRIPSDEYDLDSIDIQPIRTPTAMNGAYQSVTLWNGQFGATGLNAGTEAFWTEGTPIATNALGYEGLETQAIAGLSVHRMDCDPSMAVDMPEYGDLFDQAFLDFPVDERMSLETAGLAIAAYERTVMANESPWQEYLNGNESALSNSEKRGAELFFNAANCYQCHSGPALNSMAFEAIGMKNLEGPGTYGTSNADAVNLGRASFTGNTEDEYKFKVPQLYNLKDSPFFGHGGTLTDIQSVIEYKNQGIPENPDVPSSQLSEHFVPLNLTEDQITDLVNFIENGLYDPNLFRYVPSELPSGYCFPNNDPVSQVDQGCIN